MTLLRPLGIAHGTRDAEPGISDLWLDGMGWAGKGDRRRGRWSAVAVARRVRRVGGVAPMVAFSESLTLNILE
jgi:hypothetical protein